MRLLTNECILKVEGVSKTFPGTRALSDVKIEVMSGEVHGLIGENGAGKSTLMNVVSGVLRPDKGKISYRAKEVNFRSPSEARASGIGFVHQELALCQHMTVAENMYMGRMPLRFLGVVNYKKLYKNTEQNLKMFKSEINPRDLVGKLNAGNKQIVEIAKAISLDCKLLMLDEPTSSLSENETETLFGIIKELKKNGIGILYVSHRIAEIFEICDSVTVLRDGKYIDTFDVSATTPQKVVNCMVGREISDFYPKKSSSTGKNLLDVKNLRREGIFSGINFSLKKGEIVGFSGLVGAGRTEVARAICAIDPLDSGEIYIEGKRADFNSYSEAIKNGVCYLTEDRKQEGLFLELGVRQNITSAIIKSISRRLIISSRKENEIAEEFARKLNVKITNINQKINSLSGGNQQKTMVAKWLSTNPKILFLDEPTRGIDVGAKAEIHNMLRKLAESGIGIIIISSELPEIIGMCDRVVVMHEGIISGEVKGEEISEQRIIMLASGQ